MTGWGIALAGLLVGLLGLSALLARRLTRRELELKRSRQELTDFFENATEGLHWLDPDGRILWVNQAELRASGYKRSEFIGHPISEFHDDPQVAEDMLRRIRQGESLHNYEARFRSKNGTVVDLLVNTNSLIEDGRLIHTRCFSRDITKRKRAEAELTRLNQELESRVAERTRELEDMTRQMSEASRRAGMAEIATNVLHNVGNVLNSVSVSATLLSATATESPVAGLERVVALIQGHEENLGAFVTNDPRGKHLPEYLESLADHLRAQQAALVKELHSLQEHIEHIKAIVTMQQRYATATAVRDTVSAVDLVEDSLRLTAGALDRHQIELVRDYKAKPTLTVDKHEVVQILVNLVRNAKHACSDSGLPGRRVTVRVTGDDQTVRFSVIDNGFGILDEHRTSLFRHGFTTRKDGHGFGLHSAALAAKRLGGSLDVDSHGRGRGATFTLTLPREASEDIDAEIASVVAASG